MTMGVRGCPDPQAKPQALLLSCWALFRSGGVVLILLSTRPGRE